MSKRFDLITQQLLGKDLNDCSVEELQHLTEQYPYFAPAQFVLLQKLKLVGSPDYRTQVQKSILYYHNPFAFDHFMNAESYEVEFAPTEMEAPIAEEAPINAENDQLEATETVINSKTAYQEEKPETREQEIVTLPDELNASIEQEPTEDEQIATKILSEQQAEIDIQEEPQKEVELPKLVIAEQKADESALAFEPYHTVDYFASQGIKLSKEEATKDKFGKQLKSFTEWLKTMKKLPVSEQQTNKDVSSEKKVESLAAHSVEKAEILTETMAEVWAKQGNKEKALEIYQQLSLLNPSKLAYFAAKIDSLK